MTDTIGASIITDHAFEPKGDWFSLCKQCNLGEAAHRRTTLRPQARRGELPSPNVPVSPRWSGELCTNCGNEMVRTGSCMTCAFCGETTGCG